MFILLYLPLRLTNLGVPAYGDSHCGQSYPYQHLDELRDPPDRFRKLRN